MINLYNNREFQHIMKLRFGTFVAILEIKIGLMLTLDFLFLVEIFIYTLCICLPMIFKNKYSYLLIKCFFLLGSTPQAASSGSRSGTPAELGKIFFRESKS